jgi:hypothetical protein
MKIHRKFIFTMSILIIIVCGLIIGKTGIGTSLTAAMAVNQLSNDIVLSSVAREMVIGNSIVKYNGYFLTLGIVGFIFSFIKKGKKEDVSADNKE